MRRWRLAIVTSHPIQYQAPWFRALAGVTDLTVFFCHKQDASDHARAGFGVAFEWDVPLVEGYDHRWLKNVSSRPDVSTFRGCDTPEIGGVLRGGGFDACIVSGWYLKSYLQAIRACRRAGIPVLVRGDSQLATRRSSLVNAAKYFPYKWLLQHIDGHLYVGQANRSYLRHYGVAEENLFFVPHFVDNGFFARGASEALATGAAAEIRGSIGAGPHSTVFIFAGKLVEKKRPGDYLQALRMARDRGADVRGLVVGAGPLGADLQSFAEHHDLPVSFAGFRNQTEMPRYLAAADTLVLPSDGGETWGLVVNEAMACGLPAIVSRAAGCAPDLIDEGRTGYGFDLGDVDQLCDAMLKVSARRADGPGAFREDVSAKIDQYSIAGAVSGTLRAVGLAIGRSTATELSVTTRHNGAAHSLKHTSHD
jgi:glycosyltransferase involved in cell wall biosynthesis